jgi:hypothetical protein
MLITRQSALGALQATAACPGLMAMAGQAAPAIDKRSLSPGSSVASSG